MDGAWGPEQREQGTRLHEEGAVAREDGLRAEGREENGGKSHQFGKVRLPRARATETETGRAAGEEERASFPSAPIVLPFREFFSAPSAHWAAGRL